MRNDCELCGQDALAFLYEPESSSRGLRIFVCEHCGLVQSLPRTDRAARAEASISSGADWGNVRYGKAFRTPAAIEALLQNIEVSGPLSLLDVGSNRGSFARAFLEFAPQSDVVALEPDERLAEALGGLDRVECICARIEDAALESGRFDIVHSCHTIEHLAHPARTLRDHWRALKPGGILLVDAPNIALLGSDDIVEEWFIDKHLTHFSARTLGRMIESAGFEIVAEPHPSDSINLLFVGRKRAGKANEIGADHHEVARAKALVARYIETRCGNIEALSVVATELSSLSSRRVALWGAGRLFDSLVVHGRFDPSMLNLLIDTHLKSHLRERHGFALSGPEALAGAKPDVVVIMSRGFAGEIADEVRALAPNAEIRFFSDLISKARLKKAA